MTTVEKHSETVEARSYKKACMVIRDYKAFALAAVSPFGADIEPFRGLSS
jgi:hypothetical protein